MSFGGAQIPMQYSLYPYGHLGGQMYSELTIGLSASPHDSCGVHVASTMSSHHGGMHGDAVTVYHDGYNQTPGGKWCL